MTALFVWTRGLKGPTPERWPERLCDMSGKPIPVLQSHELSAADALRTFNELMEKYPYVVPKETVAS